MRALRGVFVFLLMMQLSACSFYKEVEVSEVKDITVTRFDKDFVEAEVEVVINNPNWYRVLLTDSDIDVYLNGDKIGKIQLREQIVLPRKTLNTRTILMKGDYEAMQTSFLESILTVLFASSSKVKVEGYMKGRAFFVSRKVDVALEKDIDLRELQQESP